jgi:GT2 family glycosyltransferase
VSEHAHDVSVLLVSWNSAAVLEGCLRSLHAFPRTRRIEVVVVDNGSRDGTPALVQREFPAVRLVRAGANLGFAPSANAALRLATGRLVLFLNPDTRLRTDVVTQLADFLDVNPAAGAAGPRLLDEDGRINAFAARAFPTLRGALFTQLGLRKLAPHSRLLAPEALPLEGLDRPQRVPCLTGAALMIPRRLLDRIGPLDQRLPMYFEDLDLCARLAAAGHSIHYVPEALLVHLGARSADLSPRRSLLLALEFGEAPWLYFRVHRGRAAALLFRVIMLLGAGTRTLLLLAAAPLLALRPGRRAAVRGHLRRATALLGWAVTPPRRLAASVSRLFAGDDVLETNEDFQRELRRSRTVEAAR